MINNLRNKILFFCNHVKYYATAQHTLQLTAQNNVLLHFRRFWKYIPYDFFYFPQLFKTIYSFDHFLILNFASINVSTHLPSSLSFIHHSSFTMTELAALPMMPNMDTIRETVVKSYPLKDLLEQEETVSKIFRMQMENYIHAKNLFTSLTTVSPPSSTSSSLTTTTLTPSSSYCSSSKTDQASPVTFSGNINNININTSSSSSTQ